MAPPPLPPPTSLNKKWLEVKAMLCCAAALWDVTAMSLENTLRTQQIKSF